MQTHVLDDLGAAVLVLFNLSSEPVRRTIAVPLAKLGMSVLQSARGAEVQAVGDQLQFEVEVPPLSPHLIELNTVSM